MLQSPTVSQLIEVAATLGIHLEREEAAVYRSAATDRLRHLDDFLAARLPEEEPPLCFPERGPGHRPTDAEDRYRAWLWRCEIGGSESGLLGGKAVSFKDHISVAAIRQSFTSYALDGFIPTCDATVVTRVLQAGGKVLGKNMMSGFMNDYGSPINPHNPNHEAGGSSSGSAVALAAGQVDISFGGDQGGSVRIPAAYCGVVGLKPTFGLISHFGISFGFEPTVDHVGPMGRTVEDVSSALEAVAGFDPYDPRQRRDVPENLSVLNELPKGVRGLRVGVLDEGFDEPITPEVRDGILAAIDVLSAAGAVVHRMSVPEHRSVTSAYAALALEGTTAMLRSGLHGSGDKTYYPTSAIAAVNTLWNNHADQFPPSTKLWHIVAELSRRQYHGSVYAKAQNVRSAFVAAYDRALEEVDVLVLPTIRQVAPAIGQPPADLLTDLAAALDGGNWLFLPYTYNTKPSCYTGHPALAVPCGKVGGLPISMQLIGRHWEDALLLRVAYAYQESVDWNRIIAVEG